MRRVEELILETACSTPNGVGLYAIDFMFLQTFNPDGIENHIENLRNA